MTEGRYATAGPVNWARRGIAVPALGVGLAGLATFVVGAVVEPPQAYYSYLVAYAFGVSIAVGALILVMTEHLIAATWFVAMRRIAEAIAGTLPLLALLFLPIAFGVKTLYPWVEPARRLDPHAAALVARKAAYLNVPFFLIRAGIYFTCWIALSELLRRWSLRQDGDPGEFWTVRQRALSAPGVILLAFTLTWAAFDWLMSLAPTWYSTIFGVIIFAGGMVGAIALMAILLEHGARDGALGQAVTPDHFSALGKLLFTFVIFWAYTSFAQLLIIWIGNIPEEVTWYVVRINGPWLGLSLAIAIGHFGVPFFLLLSYELKRRGRLLATLGGWMLAMHYLDLYWIVMPALHPEGIRPHWLDVSALATIGGLGLAWVCWRARGMSALPVGDPELVASLRYSET